MMLARQLWGTEAKEAQVTAYAYGNDGSVKLHHCYDEVFDEPMQAEGWGQRCTIVIAE